MFRMDGMTDFEKSIDSDDMKARCRNEEVA